MKFVSLRTKRIQGQRKPDKSSRATRESFTEPTALHHQIHTYVELRQQIHDDLRIQHPEWVEPDGKSPMCDSYEARLVALLDSLTPSEATRNATTAIAYCPMFCWCTMLLSIVTSTSNPASTALRNSSPFSIPAHPISGTDST